MKKLSSLISVLFVFLLLFSGCTAGTVQPKNPDADYLFSSGETEGITINKAHTQSTASAQSETSAPETTTEAAASSTTVPKKTQSSPSPETEKETASPPPETTKKKTTEQAGTTKETTEAAQSTESESQSEMVWIPNSGAKYHKSATCSGMKNPSHVTLSDAKERGYTPCKKCYK